MAEFLILIRGWDYLKRLDRANVPDDEFIDPIYCVNKGAPLNDIDTNDRSAMTPQEAKMSIAIEVLWAPNVRINFKTS